LVLFFWLPPHARYLRLAPNRRTGYSLELADRRSLGTLPSPFPARADPEERRLRRCRTACTARFTVFEIHGAGLFAIHAALQLTEPQCSRLLIIRLLQQATIYCGQRRCACADASPRRQARQRWRLRVPGPEADFGRGGSYKPRG